MEISNPHDRFFRETFSRTEIARDFLRNYLPEEVSGLLDFSSLELRKDSFVNPDLQQHFSDLLYKVDLRDGREAYAYLLFEHKSYPESLVAFQLLRYLVRIWEQERRQGRNQTLAPIIPLVIYHGRAKRRVPLDFRALFLGPEELRPYWPSFQYQLVDLSAFSDEDIKGEVTLRAILLLLRHIFDETLMARLPDILSLLRALASQETALEYLETMLRYVTQAAEKVSEAELAQAVRTAFPREIGGDIMSTLAEMWMEQGVARGLEQATQNSVIEVLEIRFGSVPEEIVAAVAQIHDLDALRSLFRQAVTVDSLTTFRLYLQERETDQ